MPAPEIPPEIVDAIVDQLASDTQTLLSCILVAKSWVPRSRTHLFRHILVEGHSSLDRFLKRLRVFGPEAHSLTINEEPHPAEYADGVLKIPRTQDLSSFTSLAWLFLRGIEFPTFHALAQLMASSPSLEKIALVAVRWRDSGVEGPAAGKTECLPHLRQLYISCLEPQPIFDWFGRHDLPGLHHVGTTLCPGSSDAQILAFLNKIPLDHLEIGPNNAAGFRSLVDSISAKHGLALHTTMYYDHTTDMSHHEFFRRPLPPHTAHRFITRMIRLTPTSMFCHLLVPSSSAEQYDWEGLDYIFTTYRFSNVRRFVLLLSSPLLLQEQGRMVRSKLPMSNRRGVLFFSQMGR